MGCLSGVACVLWCDHALMRGVSQDLDLGNPPARAKDRAPLRLFQMRGTRDLDIEEE
jgi:hypothetical protein